jgi:hypothetical protein
VRISRGWVAVVLIATLTASGCSDGADDPVGGSSGKPAEAAAPSPEPTPTRYTDEQLGAALPRGRQQLHGIAKVAVACRDLTKPCNGTRGWGIVDAKSDPAHLDLVVSINHQHRGSLRQQRRRCPDGPVDKPVHWLNPEHTSYRPGERAEARFLPLTIGEWRGGICQKTGVILWPHGETSARHTWQEAYLTNGLHDLTTAGRTLRLTETLAREYLARLTVSAGLTTGTG